MLHQSSTDLSFWSVLGQSSLEILAGRRSRYHRPSHFGRSDRGRARSSGVDGPREDGEARGSRGAVGPNVAAATRAMRWTGRPHPVPLSRNLRRRGCPPVLRPCSPPRWALRPGAGRPCHAAAQARRRWTCRSVLLRSAVAVPRWSRWTWSRGGVSDDARSARAAVMARVVGRGGAREDIEASGAGEVVEFGERSEPDAPLHHPNRARRAALGLTTTRVTRAAASRATLGPECTGE